MFLAWCNKGPRIVRVEITNLQSSMVPLFMLDSKIITFKLMAASIALWCSWYGGSIPK